MPLERMLHDSDALRRFAGVKLGDDRIPDEMTILNFRHLLHGDGTSIFVGKGYVSAAREGAFSGPEKTWGVMRKAPRGCALQSVRARAVHPFRERKRQFRDIKTRDRGLARTARSCSCRSLLAICFSRAAD